MRPEYKPTVFPTATLQEQFPNYPINICQEDNTFLSNLHTNFNMNCALSDSFITLEETYDHPLNFDL